MEKDDKIIFKYDGVEIQYKVVALTGKRCFLSTNGSSSNKKIFFLLGIEDRFAFCERAIGYPIVNRTTDFPEVNSLEDLEKIIDALYQRILDISAPKLNVGDLVSVLERKRSSTDYPMSYTDSMTKYSNKGFFIKEVHKMPIAQVALNMNRSEYEEPFYYILEGNGFYWSSAMLQKSGATVTYANEKVAEGTLEYSEYKNSTSITFKIRDSYLKYKVVNFGYDWFLCSDIPDYDRILKIIGVDCSTPETKVKFIRAVSGCPVKSGLFPFLICKDSSGITKVINAINEKLAKINAEYEKQKVIQTTFKSLEKTEPPVCPEGPQNIIDSIDIEAIGKVPISPHYKIAPSASLVCDTFSNYYESPVVFATSEQISLYDRIKTPVQAEYKLNFKN